MALNLSYPLNKGTYKRFRGYASHVKWNPGTWYGDDDSCKVGTQGSAEEDGYVSLSFKRKTGGGWSFLLNFTKYPGWGSWHAHCSQIPKNGQRFKRGQKMFKTGKSGDVDGAHLHHSLLHKEGRYLVAKNLDSKSVVKWVTEDKMANDSYKKSIVAKIKEITNLKGAVKSKATEIVNLKKVSSQQKEHIKSLQIDLKQSIGTINKQSVLLDDTRVEIKILKEKLKSCQHSSETTTDTKKGGGNEMLEGKKTYIVAAVLILSAIGQYLTGDLTLSAAITLVLGALGLGALRRGIESK